KLSIRTRAQLRLILLQTNMRTQHWDHHILRYSEWRTRMDPIFRAGKEHDVCVLTAAEFAGKPVEQLEANRDRLYGFDMSPKGISGTGPSEGGDGEGAPLPE